MLKIFLLKMSFLIFYNDFSLISYMPTHFNILNWYTKKYICLVFLDHAVRNLK